MIEIRVNNGVIEYRHRLELNWQNGVVRKAPVWGEWKQADVLGPVTPMEHRFTQQDLRASVRSLEAMLKTAEQTLLMRQSELKAAREERDRVQVLNMELNDTLFTLQGRRIAERALLSRVFDHMQPTSMWPKYSDVRVLFDAIGKALKG